jgi:tRNA (adenine22-N1)-methyltransferase
MTSRMRFVLADGLEGVEPEREGADHILICGMGGELIARILCGSDYVKTPGVRLILGPMSSPEELRLWLAENGFRIDAESLAESAGKRYATILAEYDGKKRRFTPAELLLGKHNIEEYGPLFREFAGEWLDRVCTRIAGRKRGGLPTAEDEALRDEIAEILERSGENRTGEGGGCE